MIVIILFLTGGVVGAMVARRRKGNLLDMLQYAAVYALIGTILGLALSVVLQRLF